MSRRLIRALATHSSSNLTLAELHVFVLTSFIKFNKVPIKFNEVFAKPYHVLIEVVL